MEAVQTVLHKLHMSGAPQKDAPLREPSVDELEQLRKKYQDAQQEQVFSFYDDLSSTDKATLYHQLASINPQSTNKITDRALNPPKTDHRGRVAGVEPLPSSATASILDSKPEDIKKWYDSGLDLIAANKVAVVLMAGGQGTRLGSSDPKGCFDIGLPSQKSLFQIQAERIRKIERLAHRKAGHGADKKIVVPWYVMTSGPTRGPTEKYFADHNYFGLNKKDIIIFEQGVLPCISNEGKILLESKSKVRVAVFVVRGQLLTYTQVAVAPDGNGGIYQALVTSSVMEDMRKRGIEHIHAYCVDNCLVKVADPVFIGFSAEKNVDIATKVVRKRSATESVGLILLKNGKPGVVEYSEIDKETAEAKDPKQPSILKFRAANIVNHYYSFRFLESIPEWADKLPHHVARKKIPYVDTDKGTTVKPEKPNGIKLEQFVFDCFSLLELDKFACLEVERQDEFSPLKNARGTGEDDPDTSKRDIMAQGKRWLQQVGATVVSEEKDEGVEISPLMSYGGEGLEQLHGKTITAPAVLEIDL